MNFSWFSFSVIFLLLVELPGSICLRMVDFYVPEFANRGDKIVLKCGFELENLTEELYSVKWYKYVEGENMLNFYSYSHNSNQPKKHKIEGVRVVIKESNENVVTLKQLKIDSSGEYKCEVTTKRSFKAYQYYTNQGNPPRFNVIEEQARMQVVEIPKEPPVIGGGAAYYANGDELNLTCTSNPSYPPTTLTWYLNGNKVGSSKDDEALLKREDDLYITTSFLRTKVQNSLFRYGEIRVKCVAELTEEPIKARIQAPGDGFHLNILKLPEAMKLSTETIFDVPMFGAGRILSSWCFLCIFFSLIPLSV